jgi:hypothetical protein
MINYEFLTRPIEHDITIMTRAIVVECVSEL